MTSVGLFRNPPGYSGFSMDIYATSLARSIVELGDPRIELHEAVAPGIRTGKLMRYVAGSAPGRMWIRFPRQLAFARRTRFDVNHIVDHAYGHLTWALPPERTVVTCHDIYPLKLWRGSIPGMSASRRRPVTVELSLNALRRARLIVADSHSTATDLVEYIKIPPERIRVVPPGIDPALRPVPDWRMAETEGAFPSWTPDRLSILSIDSGAGYKNQRALIEVLARVQQEAGTRVCLVHVGSKLPERCTTLARQLGVDGAIVELGRVNRALLPVILSRADVLLFPSFYEGYGWPPLEAMQCGLPVVASTAPAIVEAAGGCALLADPADYDALAGHVLELLSNPQARDELITRGHGRAAQLTWEHAARHLAEIYREVAAG